MGNVNSWNNKMFKVDDLLLLPSQPQRSPESLPNEIKTEMFHIEITRHSTWKSLPCQLCHGPRETAIEFQRKTLHPQVPKMQVTREMRWLKKNSKWESWQHSTVTHQDSTRQKLYTTTSLTNICSSSLWHSIHLQLPDQYLHFLSIIKAMD